MGLLLKIFPTHTCFQLSILPGNAPHLPPPPIRCPIVVIIGKVAAFGIMACEWGKGTVPSIHTLCVSPVVGTAPGSQETQYNKAKCYLVGANLLLGLKNVHNYCIIASLKGFAA